MQSSRPPQRGSHRLKGSMVNDEISHPSFILELTVGDDGLTRYVKLSACPLWQEVGWYHG